MNSIASSAVSGINSGLANLAQDAQLVAQSVSPASNALSLVNALVDSIDQRLAVEANAKVLSTANQTIGSLIDTFA
jgi:flagellar basal body rod protein FlgG